MAGRILGRYLKLLLTVVAMYMYITLSVLIDISGSSSRDTAKAHRRRAIVTQQEPVPIPAPALNNAQLPGTNRRIRKLFEHAVELNTLQLEQCDVQTRYVSFSNAQYNIFIPKWQTQPRKQHHIVSAILKVRLYEEDTARWTMAELKQWIHYQLWAGVEHIYICNDYLKKEEDIAEDLSAYSQAGLVTVIDWSERNLAFQGPFSKQRQNAYSQIACYNYVKRFYGRWSTWMFNFDMDENPYCPTDRCEGFLVRYLTAVDRNTSVLLVDNYVMHGQGDRSRDVQYDRINRISPERQNENVKPVFRVRTTRSVGMHRVFLKRGETLTNPPGLRMLHYWGGRKQNWGPDTEETLTSTLEFNDVRESIAVAVRHSLLAFGEFEAFSNSTGP